MYLELRNALSSGDTIMTYQRTNGSMIDFVIVHADQTLTVIDVSMTDSVAIPKSFHAFHVTYGHRVRQYVKSTPLVITHTYYHDISYQTIPHFFIRNILR